MKLDILSIGDELLIGQTLNTNAYWISGQLNKIGFEIRQQLTVSDQEEAIITAVDTALKQVQVVLVTGGLGPTNDDLTMPVLNRYFGGKLVHNEEVYRDIEQLLLPRGYEMNENNRKQALVPDVCKPIRNQHGTAPGLWFERGDQVVVAMPGVPYEMKAMVTDMVIPWLKAKYQLPEIVHRMVYTQGIPEAKLAEMLAEWENALPESIKLAYLPSPGRVKLRLSSMGDNRETLQQAIEEQVERLRSLIGTSIYEAEEGAIAEAVGALLRSKQATLSTAESCTGGYIAHLITAVSGSSDYFKGAIVSYANEVKENELGVVLADLERFGAVSRQVVEQMAKGARERLKTDYAVATSGIAGPLGGTPEKPVGTVWMAVATPTGVVSELKVFGKQRKVNIERAAVTVLGMLRNELMKQ
ncbi:MAG: competence/damage-inducible protein A [Flavobacteriales bacterium]|nr:competence/damage-inducible protein A [Flavobacteriales bacterium]